MADLETVFWGIHGGRTGDANSLFLNHNVIALGWVKMGDLAKLQPDREAFKVAVAATYPDAKPGAIPTNAGQLYRFVYEIKAGDFVIYPSKHDHQVHIGKVQGSYTYAVKPEPGYPHQRPAKWLCSVPRTKFSQGALHEIGSAMSFFQVRNYADGFRAAVEGKAAAPPVSQDESVAGVAADVAETTRDYILKRLAQELIDVHETAVCASDMSEPGPAQIHCLGRRPPCAAGTHHLTSIPATRRPETQRDSQSHSQRSRPNEPQSAPMRARTFGLEFCGFRRRWFKSSPRNHVSARNQRGAAA